MATTQPMLAPVIALVAWTAVMWGWMYATRIPAIGKLGMKLDANLPNGQQMSELPPRVRWKADNYNHLMEIPTIFYAVALVLAVLGDTSTVSVGLAWAFVALRVVHSLWQSLSNVIQVRFALFVLSTLPLFGLTWRAAQAAF